MTNGIKVVVCRTYVRETDVGTCCSTFRHSPLHPASGHRHLGRNEKVRDIDEQVTAFTAPGPYVKVSTLELEARLHQ